MGVEPPFIYDKPSSYTFAGPTTRAFDPKAATRASWAPPVQKPKTNGPLIDFNKHPDSYLIVPYGNLNVQPMNPKTKKRVKRARGGQLFLRLCALLGALGCMFCIIAINRTSSAVGWIIRVGPAVALCHLLYAVYHLCRGAASRPAASSASYMLFAGMLDLGLIPFFVFSAVMANADYTSNAYGWSTLFNNDVLSYDIIHAFFLICVSEAGLLTLSLCLDVYLAIVYRKITKMPPDMNPLEDNLTARPSGKHKRNKSEMTFEKHLSTSTLATQRMSNMSNATLAGTKRVPFTHTRTDSADRLTLYGNDRALDSRVSLRKEINANNQDPYRDSMAASSDSLAPSRPMSAVTPAANARSPGAGLDHKPVRSSGLANSSRPNSWLSYMDYEGMPTPISDEANKQFDEEVRPLSPVSMMSDRDISPDRTQFERQNWYQGSATSSPARQSQHYLPATQNISTHDFEKENHLSAAGHDVPGHSKKRSREPLGMNPPTPVQDRFHNADHGAYTPNMEPPAYSTPQRQALYEVQANSSGRPSMGSRPASFVGSGGKSRYYGNLRNSLGGSPTRSPDRDIYHHDEDDNESNYSRTKTMESEESDNFKVYDSEEEELERNRMEELHRRSQAIMLGYSESTENWNGVRKVSNSTGYDLKTGYAGLPSEFGLGMARRREVSGKVAEEGRSVGYGGVGLPEEKDGGVVTGQAQRGGAAGWARFKGL